MQVLTETFLHVVDHMRFESEFQLIKQEVDAFIASLPVTQIRDIAFESGMATTQGFPQKVFHRCVVTYLG